MITKELLKEYMVGWLDRYMIYSGIEASRLGGVSYCEQISSEEVAEYLADKIWDKMHPKTKEEDYFDHAP